MRDADDKHAGDDREATIQAMARAWLEAATGLDRECTVDFLRPRMERLHADRQPPRNAADRAALAIVKPQ